MSNNSKELATTYTRRINLYINGKEVKNDIASIKGAMAKLINEQARMTLGSKEYYAHAAKIKQLKGIMKEHQQSLNDTQKSWMSLSKMADSFNKYQSLFLGFVGSLAGVVLSVKSAVNAYSMFEDKLADVMKTTGLTKDQVVKLNDELKKIDTRSSQEDLLNLARVAGKLGITAENDILGFVRAADQIRVALTEDLGGDVEDSINQLGKLVDIFKLKDQFGIEQSLLKVGSAINSLGAAGTANEGYMVEFSKRVAGIAPGAGISIQNILGLGATLDELGQTAEVSGTVFSQVISKMFTDVPTYAKLAGMSVDDFNKILSQDANEAFIKVLEGAKSSGQGFGDMAASFKELGLDGTRATAVLGVLADNITKLREKQALSNKEFASGISLTNEFNVKNNTAQAELEKAKKKFAELAVELGKKLTPAYTAVISKARLMVEIISGLTNFLTKHGRVIVTVITYIAAYTVATKLAVMWENRKTQATLSSMITGKLQAAVYHAQVAAIALYNSALALLSGKIKLATGNFKLFAATLSANPIGLIVGAVVALGTALYFLSKRLTVSEAAQKAVNDVNITAVKSIVDERVKLELLLHTAKNESLSKEMRLDAITQLNKISPEYLGNLSLENIRTKEAKSLTDEYIKSLLQKAKVQAATDKLVEIQKELIELQQGEGAKPSLLQMAWNAAISGGSTVAFVTNQMSTAADNLINKTEKLEAQQKSLLNIIDSVNLNTNAPPVNLTDPLNNGNDLSGNNGSPDGGEDLTEERKKQLEKFNKFLEKQADEQYEAFMEYFHKAGADSFEAFMEAFEEKAREKDIINEALKSQKEEEAKDPAFDYALEKFAETEQGKINILEAQRKSGIIGEQEYQDKLSAIHKEAEDKRAATKEQNMERAQQITAMASNFVSAMMDFELEKAGDNEEKKAQIRRKYAGIQFAATASQIIVDTAAAIMKALAQLGPIAGPIAAALMGATGAAQLAIANAQRKKMASGKGFAEGGYTGSGQENEPAGIVHKGEWVAPNWLLGNPQAKMIIDSLEQLRRNKVNLNPALSAGRIPFASGGFAINTTASVPSISAEDAVVLTRAIEKLMVWKPKVYTEDIKKGLETLDRIDKNRKM